MIIQKGNRNSEENNRLGATTKLKNFGQHICIAIEINKIN